ncbi:MAG: hypothetical protein QXV28_07840 [Ignisphaera sp.]
MKISLGLSITVAVLAIAKALALGWEVIFSTAMLGDECYYIQASGLLMKKIIGVDALPYNILLDVINGTPILNVEIKQNEFGFLHLCIADYRNLEHPGFAKLVYGVVLTLAGGYLPILRLFLLIASIMSYCLLVYVLANKCGWRVIPGLAVLLIIDRLTMYFSYLAFLDTLMLVFLNCGIALYLLKKKKLSLVLLSLATACKAPGLVLALPIALSEIRGSGFRRGLIFMLAPALALGASYSINLLLASPQEVLQQMFSMLNIVEDTCRSPFCLFALKEEFGGIILYPPILWLWFVALALMTITGEDTLFSEDRVPVSVAIVNILFTMIIWFKRSIFVYYYLPAVALIPFAIAIIIEKIEILLKRFTSHFLES